MPSLQAEFAVPSDVSTVYAYLEGRYDTDLCRTVSLMAKGYLPEVAALEKRKDELLAFSVAGRDSLLKFKVSGWQWSYALKPADGGGTRVAIRYEWSLFMSFISLWTVRMQAANELIETAMALGALGFARPADTQD